MIIGNPDNFAVYIDKVNEWNDISDIWLNGICAFYIKTKLIPKEFLSHTIELRTCLGGMAYNNLKKSDLKYSKFSIREILEISIEKNIKGIYSLELLPDYNFIACLYIDYQGFEHFIWTEDSFNTIDKTTFENKEISSVLQMINNNLNNLIVLLTKEKL